MVVMSSTMSAFECLHTYKHYLLRFKRRIWWQGDKLGRCFMRPVTASLGYKKDHLAKSKVVLQ